MDNVLYEYLFSRQNRATEAQSDEVITRHPRPNSVTPSKTPVFVFQKNRAGPLQGAGDVQGAVNRCHPGWLERFLTDMEKAAPAKQLVVGGISGWASGYVCGKVGRVAAIAVGGSLVLLQIASYQGYIHINWSRLETRLEDTRRRFNEHTFDNLPNVIENLREFARRHYLITGSFFAGFLIGIAT